MSVAERIDRLVELETELSRGILAVVQGDDTELDGELSDTLDDAHRALQAVSEHLQDARALAAALP